MPRVGFLLAEHKRPRVLTPALQAAAAHHGLELLPLDLGSSAADLRAANLDVLVAKLPAPAAAAGQALQELLATAAAHPGGGPHHQQAHGTPIVLDPPAAVAALRDREAMLAPLLAAGAPGGLVLQQGGAVVRVSAPVQATLSVGCDVDTALQLLEAAGLCTGTQGDCCWPLLVKPLHTHPADAAAPATRAGGSAAEGKAHQQQQQAVHDGHALGAVWSIRGLQLLLSPGAAAGECLPQEQQQQWASSSGGALVLPLVLQQYVPHAALYKLYVIGPHCVLTRRTTLTVEMLAAAKAAAGPAGVTLLPRVSAVALAPPPAAAAPAAAPIGTAAALEDALRGVGSVALADPSAAGDPSAPPLWAMQQLAAHFRAALGLSLFNLDVIVRAAPAASEQQPAAANGKAWDLLVVDVNFMPGYDKVPGAEPLFAAFLAAAAAGGPAAAKEPDVRG